MYTIEMSRLMKAPPSVVWGVISDHQLYGNVAPNLKSVEVIGGDSQGMIRRCTEISGHAWEEQCVLWQPENQYIVEVDTSPTTYPLAQMRGTFRQEKRLDGCW